MIREIAKVLIRMKRARLRKLKDISTTTNKLIDEEILLGAEINELEKIIYRF